MTSKIVVNNIEADAGISTVAFGSKVSATEFIGPVSGNVTGDVSGNVTGDVTGNVTGNATGLSGSPTLTGITSISTTNLTVNGNSYPSAGPLSNRNLIINGAMNIWQRATTITGVADNVNEGYQSVDRFGFSFASTHGGACTISRSTEVPSGEGFAQSYKVDITSSVTPTANQSTGIFTKIEAQDIANSGWDYTSTSSYITLSFWARSTKAGTYCVFLDSQDAATYERYIKEYTLVANTWKKVTITVPGKSTLAYNNDNGEGMNVFWMLSAGSNRNTGTDGTWQTGTNNATSNQVNFFDSDTNDFYLTGVQLEVGEVATPFEHRSYADELHRCQRYYYRHADGSWDVNHAIASGVWYATTSFYGVIHFPVMMCFAPTLKYSNNANSGAFLVFGAGVSSNTDDITTQEQGRTSYVITIYNLSPARTAGAGAWAQLNNEAGAHISFEAEL